ncbi:serine hydrolase [Kribbella flavida]|uniref:serine hydrolase n=1 Tax=Kribbella flavida TaxID=182640 RepID=UPI00019BF9D2|nr:serine hydrolase [Kribbella flavida]
MDDADGSLQVRLAVQAAYADADGALLSPASGRALLTPQIPASERIGGLDHLGLGLLLGADGVRFGHSGGKLGFECHLLIDREAGTGAAVMTNGENGMRVIQLASTAGRTPTAGTTPNRWRSASLLRSWCWMGSWGSYRLREGCDFDVTCAGG